MTERRTILRVVVGLGMLTATATLAGAAIRNVPTEFTTIQDAIDASSVADTVLIAPGVYTGLGNRDLLMKGKLLQVQGAGPDLTIIDCEGSSGDPHWGVRFHANDTKQTTLSGVAVINAHTSSGAAALDTGTGGEGTILNCRIENCEFLGGSIVGRFFDIEDSTIENCRAITNVQVNGTTIKNSIVRNNTGGGVSLSGCSPVIDGCLIQGNSEVGIIDLAGCFQESTIERTVISGNRIGLSVFHLQQLLTIRETTIVGQSLIAMEGFQASVGMENCTIWGNRLFGEAGIEPISWVLSCCIYPDGAADGGGFTLEGPQIHEDPLFCDPIDWVLAPTSDGDYSVQANSPCLPENNVCQTQIGALGIGDCDPATAPGPDALAVPNAGIEFTCALPVRDELRFRTHLTHPAEAQIVDLRGRVVASKPLSARGRGVEYVWHIQDEPSYLANGVYFLRVRSSLDAATLTKRFVWLAR